MCELFAMSARFPTTIRLSFDELARHGGGRGPHRDGWGVGLWQDGDALVIREPDAAHGSRWVQFLQEQEPRTSIAFAHRRRRPVGIAERARSVWSTAVREPRRPRNTDASRPGGRAAGRGTRVVARGGRLGPPGGPGACVRPPEASPRAPPSSIGAARTAQADPRSGQRPRARHRAMRKRNENWATTDVVLGGSERE